MRALAMILVLLVAGCVSDDAARAPTPDQAPTVPSSGAANATRPGSDAPPVGPRHASMERFVLLANRTIGVQGADDAPLPEATVPEENGGMAFYTSTASEPKLTPWSTAPFRVPFELEDAFDVRIAYRSATPAASAHPGPADLPPIVGWFGTPERLAFFLLAKDAPQSLEAGKTYVSTLHVEPPPTGFFVRAGESLALHLFLGYQTADNQPVQYVVGGDDPAGFQLPHEHFNVTAPRATVILDKSGTTAANPGVSTQSNSAPAIFDVEVPADAVFVVFEMEGTPGAPGRLDADLDVRDAGGRSLGAGLGPSAKESVVVGPGALGGSRSLKAVVGTSGPPGNVHVKATAYAP